MTRATEFLETDLTALREEIASLTSTIARLQTEVNETRAEMGTFRQDSSGDNGGVHHLTEEALAGAAKLGEGALGSVENAAQSGVAWIDDMLRKNPTPTVLTALGVGFVLGVWGRR